MLVHALFVQNKAENLAHEKLLQQKFTVIQLVNVTV